MNSATRQSRAWSRLVALVTVGVFALQASGSERLMDRDRVRDGFKDLSHILHDESLQNPEGKEAARDFGFAKSIALAVENADQALEVKPVSDERAPMDPVGAARFASENRVRILGYLKALEAASSDLRKVIFQISKQTFVANGPQIAAGSYALLYYSLEFQRDYHRKVAELLMPFLLYTRAEALKDVPEIKELNKEITQSYFRHIGAQMVSQKDKRLVLSQLRELKNNGHLPPAIEKVVNESQAEIRNQREPTTAALKNAVDHFEKNEQTALRKALQEVFSGYEKVSFLYSPEKNLSLALNILIVIGNLTWGLVNTLLGAGVVLYAMGLSAFGIVSFPTFAIAQNGRMIYVDVTGVNPLGIYGKVSLGLFELDNGTHWSFASGHEGVHAIQSAMFGPLYLPLVLVSYAFAGFDNGFMEDWAWDWANI